MILLHLRYETLRTLLGHVRSAMALVSATSETWTALRRVALRIDTDLNSSLAWLWLSLTVEDAAFLTAALHEIPEQVVLNDPALYAVILMLPDSLTEGPEDPTPFDPDTDLP